MALTATQREEYARYAFSIFRLEGGQIRTIDVLLRAYRRFGEPASNADANLARATINNIRLAFDRGEQLQNSPGTTLSVPTVGDWRLAFNFENYGWSVRVFIVNPQTSERSERLVTVLSNTPLTADEIRRRAEADVRLDPGAQGRYPELRGLSSAAVITPVIVSAGRRP